MAFFVITITVAALGCQVLAEAPKDKGSWVYETDPKFLYEYDKLPSGVYGVVGTDTWTATNLSGDIKVGSTPHVYLCKPGVKKALALEIPKWHGTNQEYKSIVRPIFLDKGKWLVAIITTNSDEDLIVAWNTKSLKPHIMYEGSRRDPKIGPLARKYLVEAKKRQTRLNYKIDAIVDEHRVCGSWTR